MALQYIAIVEPNLDPDMLAQRAVSSIASRHNGVIVLPIHVAPAVAALRGTSVQTIALVGFPFGASKPVIKAIEATSCLKDGADGVWIVPRPIAELSPIAMDALRDELLEIARAVRATRRDADLGIVVDVAAYREVSASTDLIRAVREGAADALIVLGEGAFLIEPIAGDMSIVMSSTRNKSELSRTVDRVSGLSFPRDELT